MSAVDLAEFRALLEQEREQIVSAIAHLHEDSTGSTDDELGQATGRSLESQVGDMGAITFERELDEGLQEGAQQTLAQIDRALAKIDDGTYGTCEQCGRAIGEDRLRARPSAVLCIDDQRFADR